MCKLYLLRAVNFFLAISILIASSAAFADTLHAVVDRKDLVENETLTLRVRLSGTNQPKREPNFDILKQNFEILGVNPSSQYQNINGRIQRYTDWTLTLLPKAAGKLLIPPLRYEKLSTAPIAINVKKETQVPGQLKPVMLETELSTKEAYVQQQIVLTFRLLYSQNASNLKTGSLEIDGLRLEELPRADYSKTIGNTRYQVAEFNFALIPEASGEYAIPSQLWSLNTSAQPNTRFGFSANRMKLHRLRTEEIKFTVKPRPDSYPTSATWLPAKNIILREKWGEPINNFRVGEPITRSVIIEAQGLSGEQLPQVITSRGNSDFKFYEDKPVINSSPGKSGIDGQRIENVAVVPSRSGQLVLPAIEVTWWDTDTNELKVAKLAEQTINVQAGAENNTQLDNIAPATAILPDNLPGSDTAQNPTAPAVVKTAVPAWWGLLTLILVLSNAALALMWFAQRKTIAKLKQQAPQQKAKFDHNSEQSAFNAIQATADNAEATDVREAILSWMRLRWPSQPASLEQLGQRAGDDKLASELQALDSQLFSQSSVKAWQSKSLIEALAQWRSAANKKLKSAANSDLKPLYV